MEPDAGMEEADAVEPACVDAGRRRRRRVGKQVGGSGAEGSGQEAAGAGDDAPEPPAVTGRSCGSAC